MDIEYKVMGEYLMTPKNDHDKVTGKTNLVEKREPHKPESCQILA